MTSSSFTQLLLLEQSGELSPAQRRELDARLAGNPAARAERDRIRGLLAAVPRTSREPSAALVQRVVAQAAAARFAVPASWQRPRRVFTWAAAAALALLLGATLIHRIAPQFSTRVAIANGDAFDEWVDPFEEEFAYLEDLYDDLSAHVFEHIDL